MSLIKAFLACFLSLLASAGQSSPDGMVALGSLGSSRAAQDLLPRPEAPGRHARGACWLCWCSSGTRWQCGSSAALGKRLWGSLGVGTPGTPWASLCIPPRAPLPHLRRPPGENAERNSPWRLSLPCASNSCLSSQTGCQPSLEIRAGAGSGAGCAAHARYSSSQGAARREPA